MGVKWMVAFVDFFSDGRGSGIDGQGIRGQMEELVGRLAAIWDQVMSTAIKVWLGFHLGFWWVNDKGG